MRQRLALLVGSLAGAATLAFALAASGFGTPAISPAAANAAVEPTPTERVQVDTIYLPPPQAPQTITVHRTIPSSGEHETEGGSDD